MKQSSLDEQEQMTMEMEAQSAETEEDLSDYYRPYDDPTLNSAAPGPGGKLNRKVLELEVIGRDVQRYKVNSTLIALAKTVPGPQCQ